MKKKEKIKERDKLYEAFMAENKDYPMTWKLFKRAIVVNGGIEGTKKMLGLGEPIGG